MGRLKKTTLSVGCDGIAGVSARIARLIAVGNGDIPDDNASLIRTYLIDLINARGEFRWIGGYYHLPWHDGSAFNNLNSILFDRVAYLRSCSVCRRIFMTKDKRQANCGAKTCIQTAARLRAAASRRHEANQR